jgi:hypothetical protein
VNSTNANSPLRSQSHPPRQHIEHTGLEGQQPRHDGDYQMRLLDDQGQVERHANGREEKTEQQPLERGNISLDFVTIVGVRQEHSGDEGAEGSRQSRSLHHQRYADDGKQRARGHGLLHACARDEADHSVEQIAPDDDHRDDDRDSLQSGSELHRRRRAALGDGKQRRHGDERNGSKILKKQDGECKPTMPQGELALLLQELEGEGRGGERQCQACKQRGRGGKAEPHGDDREQEGREDHLRAAQAEDGSAHGPQSLWTQFEADQKQQQDHAELGKVQDRAHLIYGIDET